VLTQIILTSILAIFGGDCYLIIQVYGNFDACDKENLQINLCTGLHTRPGLSTSTRSRLIN